MKSGRNCPDEESIYVRIEKGCVSYPFISIGAHGGTGIGIRGHFINLNQRIPTRIPVEKLRIGIYEIWCKKKIYM